MPPPRRDSAALEPTSRGSRYLSCASSTCSLPSRVRARRAKMSRMSCVRSTTFRSSASSRLRSCAGLSSLSKITTSAPSSSHDAASALTLPLPRNVAGSGFAAGPAEHAGRPSRRPPPRGRRARRENVRDRPGGTSSRRIEEPDESRTLAAVVRSSTAEPPPPTASASLDASSEERSRAGGRITRAILARGPTPPRPRARDADPSAPSQQSSTAARPVPRPRRAANPPVRAENVGRPPSAIAGGRLAGSVGARGGDAETRNAAASARATACDGTRSATVEPPPSTAAAMPRLGRHHDRQRPGPEGARQPKLPVADNGRLLRLVERRGDQRNRHRRVTSLRGEQPRDGVVLGAGRPPGHRACRSDTRRFRRGAGRQPPAR